MKITSKISLKEIGNAHFIVIQVYLDNKEVSEQVLAITKEELHKLKKLLVKIV